MEALALHPRPHKAMNNSNNNNDMYFANKVYGSSFRRTRNDDYDYFGSTGSGFRRSTSLRRSNNNMNTRQQRGTRYNNPVPGRVERSDTLCRKPGYQQDTFSSSVRQSRDRKSPSVSRSVSMRRGSLKNGGLQRPVTQLRYENELPKSSIRPPSASSSNWYSLATVRGDRNSSINYNHSHSNSTKSTNAHGNGNLLRTFSFRTKPNSDDLFSSMPCLNQSLAHTPNQYRLLHRDSNENQIKLNSQNSTTPSSSSLILNSLAYQILPPHATSHGSQGNNHHQSTHHKSQLVSKNGGSQSSLQSGNSSLSSGSQSMYSATSSAHPSPTQIRKRPVADDADGHLAYLSGDVLNDRYKILNDLGEGTFGKVAKCRDLETNAIVALKIIKNIHKYREAAKLEINVLKKLNAQDPSGEHLCVRMFDSFNYYGHMCLTFEVLGESVFDFLKSNAYEPYPLEQVRHISHQLCRAVAFMHDIKLTHTDLKPENVLFVSNDWYVESPGPLSKSKKPVRRMRDSRIKLIDFGSATFDWEHHSSVVSTRHYRAPEVILQLGWAQPCDVWSIGCIIFELHHGHTLFQTHDNREHLAMMEKILDRPMPHHMVRKSRTKYYSSQFKLLWDKNAPEAKYTNQNCKYLYNYQKFDRNTRTGVEEVEMYNLVSRMCEYDPTARATLREALRHRFFDKLFCDGRRMASSCSVGQNLAAHILRLQI